VNPRYDAVASRAGHRCEYCRAPESIFNFAFEVEHVIPTARGGERDDDNLALACRGCNLFKADHLFGPDDVTHAEVPLFHPRRDSCDEHFQIDFRSGEIVGLTPVARATISRLQMNRPRQTAARLLWKRLGLFP